MNTKEGRGRRVAGGDSACVQYERESRKEGGDSV